MDPACIIIEDKKILQFTRGGGKIRRVLKEDRINPVGLAGIRRRLERYVRCEVCLRY